MQNVSWRLDRVYHGNVAKQALGVGIWKGFIFVRCGSGAGPGCHNLGMGSKMHYYASGCSSLVSGGKDRVSGGSWDLETRVACHKQSDKCCGGSGLVIQELRWLVEGRS